MANSKIISVFAQNSSYGILKNIPIQEINEINDEIEKYMTEEVFKIIDKDEQKIDVDEIIKLCEDWNRGYEILQENSKTLNYALNEYEKNNIFNRNTNKDNEEKTKKFIEAKMKYFKNQFFKNAEILLKKGYILIQSIRKFFTKQERTYRILLEINRSTKTEYFFKNSLEFLKGVSLGATKYLTDIKNAQELFDSFSLQINRDKMKSLQINKDNQDDFEIIQTDSTLYISVYDFLYNNNDENIKTNFRSFNRGRLYELVKILEVEHEVGDYVNINNIENENEKKGMQELVLKLKKSVLKDNISSWKQVGDLNNEELKNISYSLASVINLGEIKSTILKIQEIFSNYQKENNKNILTKKLKELFTVNKKERENNIMEALDKEAKKAIEEMVLKNIK